MNAERCKIECRDVAILNEAVFGEHQDGLTYRIEKKQDKSCMNKYIKKPPIAVTVFLLGLLFSVTVSSVATGYKVYFGQESTPLIYAQRDDVKDNTKEIELVKKDVLNNNKGVEALNKKIDEQNVKMDNGFKEIKDFMKIILRRHDEKNKDGIDR
jgi:hypothetical protein